MPENESWGGCGCGVWWADSLHEHLSTALQRLELSGTVLHVLLVRWRAWRRGIDHTFDHDLPRNVGTELQGSDLEHLLLDVVADVAELQVASPTATLAVKAFAGGVE